MNDTPENDFEHLRWKTAQQRITFIDTDIDLALIFLRMATAESNMGNLARVDQLLSKARRAHEVTAKFLAAVEDMAQWQRLHDKHDALADAIHAVERRGWHEE